LSEGDYEVKVYVYSDVDLYLDGGSNQKCVSVSKTGVLGLFGMKEERCFDLDVPGQDIDTAVSGGGFQNYYVTESELAGSRKVVVSAMDFGVPSQIEDLQINFNNIEISRLNVRLE